MSNASTVCSGPTSTYSDVFCGSQSVARPLQSHDPIISPKWSTAVKPRDPKVNELLNQVLRNELTAINQYFLHAKMFDDWGLSELAKHERSESIDEMQHAEALIDRILFLEGLPNLQDLGKLLIGQDVKEMLECDLALEMAAMPALRDAIAFCEEAGDYVTRELFDGILKSEESHVDWLETNLELIEKMGIQNYIQSQTS